jgi:hypothetical protein
MLNGQPHTTLITIVKITAYALIMFAQYRMIRRVILGRLKAVVLSWFGWSMLMGISVVGPTAGRGNGHGTGTCSGVALSATGCVLIGIAGVWSGNSFEGEKAMCFAYWRAWPAMGVFLLTSDPWITTVLAIIADLLVAIPMLERAFKDPRRAPDRCVGPSCSLHGASPQVASCSTSHGCTCFGRSISSASAD